MRETEAGPSGVGVSWRSEVHVGLHPSVRRSLGRWSASSCQQPSSATGRELRQSRWEAGARPAAGESGEAGLFSSLCTSLSLIYFCRNAFEGRDVPTEQARGVQRRGAVLDLQIACSEKSFCSA